MEENLFYEIFDNEIYPLILQIQQNNPKIRTKDIETCKKEIFNKFCELHSGFKEVIFGGKADANLLDRHKIASCICGAFLKVSVFNKQELINDITIFSFTYQESKM